MDMDNLIPSSLTQADNDILTNIPSLEQTKNILFQMEEKKTPGPDGFLAIFYKEYWPVVGNAVTKAVTSFFELGSMPKEINNSLIVLIPKTQCPTSFNNFKPISLCNVIYKIISKLIVSKIRPFLHKLISPT